MTQKYTIKSPVDTESKTLRTYFSAELIKDGTCMAMFFFKTDAQMVCDLLNETSRSQGKHT